MIKCLMAGPVDSPYALGLFEFDIFLPLRKSLVRRGKGPELTAHDACRIPSSTSSSMAQDHWRRQGPIQPQLVCCKETMVILTKQGRLADPSLVSQEGKVCLSLLGTWPGRPDEMWQPGQSTLLQVLMSILSMSELCAFQICASRSLRALRSYSSSSSTVLGTQFPFYNEPGFGAPKNDKRNKGELTETVAEGRQSPTFTKLTSPPLDYNANCSLATARWAIINWMDDSFQQSIWAVSWLPRRSCRPTLQALTLSTRRTSSTRTSSSTKSRSVRNSPRGPPPTLACTIGNPSTIPSPARTTSRPTTTLERISSSFLAWCSAETRWRCRRWEEGRPRSASEREEALSREPAIRSPAQWSATELLEERGTW